MNRNRAVTAEKKSARDNTGVSPINQEDLYGIWWWFLSNFSDWPTKGFEADCVSPRDLRCLSQGFKADCVFPIIIIIIKKEKEKDRTGTSGWWRHLCVVRPAFVVCFDINKSFVFCFYFYCVFGRFCQASSEYHRNAIQYLSRVLAVRVFFKVLSSPAARIVVDIPERDRVS